MGPGAELHLEQRLASLEASIATLAARVDKLDDTRQAPRNDRDVEPLYRRHDSSRAGSAEMPGPAGPAAASPLGGSLRPTPRAAPWFTTKSAEWWLGRLGVVFTSLALVFLYQYAVERNWITPAVRITTGVFVGAAFLYAGARIGTSDAERSGGDDVGLRELLLAGGLAAWYITAYAAAVFYQLISLPTARFVFFALSIASAWLALRERRSLFGVVSVATGFAAPFLLRSATDSLAAFSLYVAALTGVGLVLYLMRGWQSVLWVTFAGAWWTTAFAAGHSLGRQSVPLALLTVAITAAFVRVPAMRRRLLATGADRYVPAPPSRFSDTVRTIANAFARIAGGDIGEPDSPALWTMPIASPLFMLLVLSQVWPAVPDAVWGAIALIAGYAAFYLSRVSRRDDSEVIHVAVTAAAIWTLAGLWWLSSTLGDLTGLDGASIALAMTALHAGATLSFAPTASLTAPRAAAMAAAGVALAVVFAAEAAADARPAIPWEQTAAELVVLAVAAMIWKRLRDSTSHRWLAVFFGVGAYIALLIIAERVLGDIWPPLVTTSYAIAGAVLLIASKRVADGRILRKLGGGTMLLVAARLFLVDLAGVETIWRVLLFMVCGLLFLYTSYRLKPPRETIPAAPPADRWAE
ncbi:MAG: DUF2339 domain-containing protein [Gemmatimonadaceae bacterium]|nr:DUF2339 domain-containing protein [Gemmatimonadaceae bacterium]